MHRFSYLPKFNAHTNSRASKNHPWCIIVKQVQKYNQLTNEVQNNRFRWKTFHGLVFIPELDICQTSYTYMELLLDYAYFYGIK